MRLSLTARAWSDDPIHPFAAHPGAAHAPGETDALHIMRAEQAGQPALWPATLERVLGRYACACAGTAAALDAIGATAITSRWAGHARAWTIDREHIALAGTVAERMQSAEDAHAAPDAALRDADRAIAARAWRDAREALDEHLVNAVCRHHETTRQRDQQWGHLGHPPPALDEAPHAVHEVLAALCEAAIARAPADIERAAGLLGPEPDAQAHAAHAELEAQSHEQSDPRRYALARAASAYAALRSELGEPVRRHVSDYARYALLDATTGCDDAPSTHERVAIGQRCEALAARRDAPASVSTAGLITWGSVGQRLSGDLAHTRTHPVDASHRRHDPQRIIARAALGFDPDAGARSAPAIARRTLLRHAGHPQRAHIEDAIRALHDAARTCRTGTAGARAQRWAIALTASIAEANAAYRTQPQSAYVAPMAHTVLAQIETSDDRERAVREIAASLAHHIACAARANAPDTPSAS